MEETLRELLDKIKGGKLRDNDTLPEAKEFETTKSLEKTVDLGAGREVSVNLGGAFKGSLSLINRSDKTERKNDPEGVLLKSEYRTKALTKALDPKPLIDFPKDGTAYLRYKLGLEGRFGAEVEEGIAGLAVEGEVDWSTSYYARHPFEKNGQLNTIGEAVLDDLGIDLNPGSSPEDEQRALGKIRSLFEADPLAGLDVGEIVSFAANGSIGGKITVDAGELLSGSVSYSGLFKESIPIKYDAGLELTASLSFGGHHLVAVGRERSDRYVVVVRRTSLREAGLGVRLGASVEIDLSETVKVINDYLGKLTGMPRERIEGLRERINASVAEGTDAAAAFFDGLGAGDAKTLSKLYDTLVENLEGRLEEWLDKREEGVLKPLEELEATLARWSAKLNKYAKSKLSIEFGHQYSRLDASADLLRFTCGAGALLPVLGDLIALQMDADALNDNEDIQIERFLNAKQTKISKQTGLILKIGGLAFGSTIGSEKEWIEVKDLRKKRVVAVSYLGSRNYKETGTQLSQYTMAFEANTMEARERPGSPPKLHDLDYTLGIRANFSGRLSEPLLEEMVDFGILYGGLDGKPEQAIRQLKELGLKTGVYASVEVGISVTREAARSVIRELAMPGHELYARAMARAMWIWRQGRGNFVEGRRNVEQRESVYHEVWKKLLAQGNRNGAEQLLDLRLDEFGYSELKIWEDGEFKKNTSNQRGPQAGKPKIESMAAILNTDIGYLGEIRDFRRGIQTIYRAVDRSHPDHVPQPYEKLEGVYKDLAEAWKFSYASRFLASLLDLAVQASPSVQVEQVERVFNVAQGDSNFALPGTRAP